MFCSFRHTRALVKGVRKLSGVRFLFHSSAITALISANRVYSRSEIKRRNFVHCKRRVFEINVGECVIRFFKDGVNDGYVAPFMDVSPGDQPYVRDILIGFSSVTGTTFFPLLWFRVRAF